MHNKLFHKDFTLVVIGQMISLLGNGIVRFALPLYLLSQTGSTSLFGIVMAISFLPMIVLMPIGGIIADRVNKRNIMVTLDFLTAVLMVLLYLLMDKVDLVFLVIITLMLLCGIQGAYQPTVQASIPLLHGKEHLLSANAMINQVSAFSSLVAPILGGMLFGLWRMTPIIIVSGSCFFLSAIMEIFIYIPYSKSQINQNIFHIVKMDFLDSLAFMRKEKPVILKSMGIICAFNLFLSSMIIVAIPVFITQTLQLSELLYGFSQGVLAAGGLVGGIVVGVFAKKLNIKKLHLLLLTSSILLVPIAGALWIGLPPLISYWVISISCFFLMSVATLVTVQMLTFIQEETPIHLRGKVISCVMTLSMCAQPLGQAIYGFLFDAFWIVPHWIVLLTALASSSIALSSKKIFENLG
ncbi:MFS transporter [Anaerophilus nitritogenes]|uniref:MFS transporter n=1 Tax=Anaerophilus nitritogenes TaxID=2498136 RepID=UPI00101D5BBD|nr:MFS transporter [Anaerophilus nitritogenes]